MKTICRENIVEHVKSLMDETQLRLTKSNYKKVAPFYPVKMFEKMWGSWENFEAYYYNHTSHPHFERERTVSGSSPVIITYAMNGEEIDEDCLSALDRYAKHNQGELIVLWGKGRTKRRTFNGTQYALVDKYLATSVSFDVDPLCTAQDIQIRCGAKNPLVSLDRVAGNKTTFIVGSVKQYCKVLPYDCNRAHRVAFSTGSISKIDYPKTAAGQIDKINHTMGALVLTYSDKDQRYNVRNLIYKNGEIFDLNKRYTADRVYDLLYTPALVLGDLHLPEHDETALALTELQIEALKPKNVFIHDWCSLNSINHHESKKYLTKALSYTEETKDLETELTISKTALNGIASNHPATMFNVVQSNHDDFVTKWLDTGEYGKDPTNNLMAGKLLEALRNGKNPFEGGFVSNIQFLPKNCDLEIVGYQVGKHGHVGISGAKGSPKSFTRGFTNAVIGHTHCPEIIEGTVVVGTLSKLKLSYNQAGFTTWAHANCVIHENGTHQLLFI